MIILNRGKLEDNFYRQWNRTKSPTAFIINIVFKALKRPVIQRKRNKRIHRRKEKVILSLLSDSIISYLKMSTHSPR